MKEEEFFERGRPFFFLLPPGGGGGEGAFPITGSSPFFPPLLSSTPAARRGRKEEEDVFALNQEKKFPPFSNNVKGEPKTQKESLPVFRCWSRGGVSKRKKGIRPEDTDKSECTHILVRPFYET